ncbi:MULTISPECIES: 2Fe-2S iron-sulfur cluster-binding protein, partial [Campylobacter]|uniref:2Fe-2S iron-sulfur cluster-binding protein n=1 Tax=Campylobacter TaxID=194 RepID=UPI0014763BF4
MKIIIERFDGKKKYESTYELTSAEIEGKTLLSVLLLIKQTKDVSLNFTASCRSAICGACAVRVNGHSYLACDTKMKDLLKEYDNPDTIRISPLNNFRVVSDLVVDWEPSVENLRKIRPAIVAKDEFSEDKGCVQTQAEFDRISG